MLTGLLLALGVVWIAGILLVCALCAAARSGDRQQVVGGGGEVRAARIAVDAPLARALAAR